MGLFDSRREQSGGGAGADWPVPINVAGAVDVEDPAGTAIRRRLRYSDLDPAFAIASFSVDLTSGGATPGLYERGQTLTVAGVSQAALTYDSGPPDSLVVANAYGGSSDAGDVNLGAWTTSGPFAVAETSGSVKRNGTDGAADPTLTITATATQGSVNSSSSVTYTWTGKIGHGLGDVGGGETIDEAFVLAMLSTLAQSCAESFEVSPSDQTVYQAIPTDYYNAGTYEWRKGGFVSPTEVKAVLPVTNAYGVTRSYTVLGTVNRITQTNATYTVTA